MNNGQACVRIIYIFDDVVGTWERDNGVAIIAVKPEFSASADPDSCITMNLERVVVADFEAIPAVNGRADVNGGIYRTLSTVSGNKKDED